MFSVRSNIKKNILHITLRGVFDASQGQQLLDNLAKELPKLKKGYDILTNLSELDNMDLDCRRHIESIMDLCNSYGVKTIVRIIPDKTKDIGFNIMSQFHYATTVKIYTCNSLEEAKHYIVWRSDAKILNKIIVLFKITKAKITRFSSSTLFRLLIISIFFIVLMVLRRTVGVFGASLGYLYVTVISLAGFWFRFKGGVIAALIASLIFMVEVNIFKSWEARDIVERSIYLRFFVYFLSGMVLGRLAELDKKLKNKLEFLAGHDELTGCYNLRFLIRLLENEILRSKRYNKELSLSIIDLDHFKQLNDRYGHLVGNEVLKIFAEVVNSNARGEDIIGRYGGEEFIIVFPESDSHQAGIVLERVKAKLAETQITSPYVHNDEKIKVTFSAGVASFPKNGATLNNLINAADNALYKAKNSGRNRIVVADI